MTVEEIQLDKKIVEQIVDDISQSHGRITPFEL